ncbi:hypothetical protein [Parasegetibacter sp. NRK P23]|uniref:hypothetical protein n=1 Tax=Parasegetibacter sp. NRK P23 TaxID=2942999 RepID=UPI00204427D1|nr:hypothetical protein [Parasegetibacter sp. NRK P23]MCM5528538.1 hypothetical protein [Parasegetibacter sp. NRK P23]
MRWIYFFSRVVFICNLFYLLALYIRLAPQVPEVFLTSGIIIMGSVMALYGTVLINLSYGWLLLTRKKLKQYVPLWLALVNFLFLLTQILLSLFL